MSRIGIIGGSGLYKIEGVKKVKEVSVNTPFGRPSGKFILGNFQGRDVAFLPRHDKAHTISPSHINYRANIFGMKKLGVNKIISVSACGSLREELRPLDFVVVDQFVDRTNYSRDMSFFTKGIVAHIEFSHPVCSSLSRVIYESGRGLNLNIHPKGTYINMEGPAFSTLAESNLYRSLGMDIIGMTNLAEAKLAREAEICYATLAAITDYDCWHPQHASVTVDLVISNLNKNTENAKKVLEAVIRNIPEEEDCSQCSHALKYAILTEKRAISSKIKKDLNILIGKYVK
ncbi:MAG: S-methyl-5'-thioadenosine phosphorylase [Candidatus Omnitrophica bacterium]|nr:S-methyl-5'-thioadenosine phosphorylase [Candidatus Omnitrophota bacterium]